MGAKKNNKKKGTEYSEISSAKVSEKRQIVISDCSRGGFTIAQRMDITENGHTNRVYLKGAIHVDDIHGLYELRDAVNLAIEKIEARDEDDNWDE